MAIDYKKAYEDLIIVINDAIKMSEDRLKNNNTHPLKELQAGTEIVCLNTILDTHKANKGHNY